jgi:hypothetical protein
MLTLNKPQTSRSNTRYSVTSVMGDTVQTEQHHAKNRVTQVVDSLPDSGSLAPIAVPTGPSMRLSIQGVVSLSRAGLMLWLSDH